MGNRRILVVMVALTMALPLVPISTAAAATNLECEGIQGATHHQVTRAAYGDTPLIEGTSSADVMVVDIQESFELVTIRSYAGADSVCVTNSKAANLKVNVDHLDVYLGSSADYFLFFSPIQSSMKLDIRPGGGNDVVIAPMPLYDRDTRVSQWNDGGGSGDKLIWLPTGDCGINVATDGHVSATSTGTCGDTTSAWRLVEIVLPYVFSFGLSLFGLPWVASTAAKKMFGYILARVIDVTDAGVDVFGFEKITTTPANDTVEYGGELREVLTLGGDDVVYMNHTTEKVNTGAGDDVVWMANVNYADVDGSSGNDTIRFEGFRGLVPETGVTIDLDTETWSGGFRSPGGVLGAGKAKRFENVIGTAKADTIRGGLGDNYLAGRGGNDKIYASWGDDELLGEGGNDKLYGENGRDELFGGSGNDSLFGGHGNDSLDGGTGTDILKGQWDDDVLRSARVEERLLNWRIVHYEGTDTVYGGSGDDACDFNVADSVAGCESQRVGQYGLSGYTAELTDPYGVPYLESRVPTLSRSLAGVRNRCDIDGQIKARLPGWVSAYSSASPSTIHTTVTRTATVADAGLVVTSPASTTDVGLSTSATRIAWVSIETDRDAAYNLTYEVASDYHDLAQVYKYSGELRCNTAAISASASTVPDNAIVSFGVNGETAGLTYDWDVNLNSGWAFRSGGKSTKNMSVQFYEPGTYQFTLTATTPLGRTLVDSHSVTVLGNQPPTANAGADATITSGSTYRLNGSGSDPDGDNLTYRWTKPGSVSWYSGGATSQRPWVQFSSNGDYTFTLEVCDGSACDTDQVTITVFSFGGPG